MKINEIDNEKIIKWRWTIQIVNHLEKKSVKLIKLKLDWSRKKEDIKDQNRVLPRQHTGHSKHTLPTTQATALHMDSPDGQHRNQIDYILCSQSWRHSIQSAKTRPGADCGSDRELLIAKFRLKLKKVGKTTNHSGST